MLFSCKQVTALPAIALTARELAMTTANARRMSALRACIPVVAGIFQNHHLFSTNITIPSTQHFHYIGPKAYPTTKLILFNYSLMPMSTTPKLLLF